MRSKAEVFKNSDPEYLRTWTAVRPSIGFGRGREVETFKTHRAAIRWATRSDEPFGSAR